MSAMPNSCNSRRLRLTPFRKRIRVAWEVHGKNCKSSWIAEELCVSETRVSNAMDWLERNGFEPEWKS